MKTTRHQYRRWTRPVRYEYTNIYVYIFIRFIEFTYYFFFMSISNEIGSGIYSDFGMPEMRI